MGFATLPPDPLRPGLHEIDLDQFGISRLEEAVVGLAIESREYVITLTPAQVRELCDALLPFAAKGSAPLPLIFPPGS